MAPRGKQDWLPGRWRYGLAFGTLILLVGALGVRLGIVTRDHRADAARLMARQQKMTTHIPARKGGIYAQTPGRPVPLAVTHYAPLCFVDAALVPEEKLNGLAVRLGEAVDVPRRRVYEAIRRRRESRYVVIQRDITEREVKAVKDLGFRAVGIAYEPKRSYPSGALAATVVGFCRSDGAGGGGLERSVETVLAETEGRRVMIADAGRRPVWNVAERSRPARDGRNVYLCMDAIVQRTLQEAVYESVTTFDAKWGTGVVLDPQSGRILAMCSVPTFDPNMYHLTDAGHRTNRAVTVPFEPGSIVKPIFAAMAVEAGLMSFNTEVFCENGVYRAYRGGRISDHGQRYGTLTLTDVVVHSSNIGMAKVGECMGNERLHRAARAIGFGARTGIRLPGESPGIVRDLRKWNGYSLRRVPFGQEISATAIQLAMAFGALANGGELLAPRLVDHVSDADGRLVWRSRRRVVRRLVSRSVAAQTIRAMQQVVQRGTGKASRLSRWTSFGKTGTAQIPGLGGYVDGAYAGSFVGGAPVRRPRVICLISIYWPDKSLGYYGAKVAAPYVKHVLTKTLVHLRVPPDEPSAVVATGR